MIGGKDWLDLAVVTAVSLGFISLMLVIKGAQAGRTKRQIVGTVGLVWGTVALTLAAAWLLEKYWGGPLFDVQIAPEPDVMTRTLTTAQAAALALMGAVLLGAYITVIVAVRRLMEPKDSLEVSEDSSTEGDRE